MTSFQEFLRKKAEEQHQPSRREKREEWIQAVRRLLDQILRWLVESEPEHLIQVFEYNVPMLEAGLGAYEVPALRLGVGDLEVQVIPVARNVVGSPRILGDGARLAGRVDVTDGIRKSMLRRVIKDGHETWEVLDEEQRVAPLDRASLEAVLRDLLG